VTKIANFGVFVNSNPDWKACYNISEFPIRRSRARRALKSAKKLTLKILRVDSEERKIGLSLKRAMWAQEK